MISGDVTVISSPVALLNLKKYRYDLQIKCRIQRLVIYNSKQHYTNKRIFLNFPQNYILNSLFDNLSDLFFLYKLMLKD